MLDYENELAKQRFANLDSLYNDLANSDLTADLRKKISSYCERNGLEYEYVLHKARVDSEFAAVLAKDPSRQTKHQNLAADYLTKILPNFRVLPASGDNAYFIIAGTLIKGTTSSTAKTKSIDFVWGNSKVTCYASHKYTQEAGGSQDNQFNDICAFLEGARQYSGNCMLFFAICDGKYYQIPYKKGGKTYASKIEYLEKYYGNGGQIIVCTVNDVESKFTEYMKSITPTVAKP